MRFIYNGLNYLIAPLLPLYLKKRGKKNPNYLLNWHERFGFKLVNPSNKPLIWLHSVSVGETRAMQKLILLITEQLPEYQILITMMTPTGRDTAESLYPQAIIHYIPYDLAHAVKNFYNTFKPEIGVLMETEIWPNLIVYADKYKIPLLLANARLSQKSYLGYKRFKWLLIPILNKLSGILCQDKNTADNFSKLGYNGELTIMGNTKFDLVNAPELDLKISEFKQLFTDQRKIICFSSTRDGEEELLIKNLDFAADLLYLIIPRHPERFSLVEKILVEKKICYQKRSAKQIIKPLTKVVIGDSLGEMLAYYAISYLAVIGGSFKEFGGQNPIEAIYMNKPVIFGSSVYNFKQVTDDALALGCAIQVASASELVIKIKELSLNFALYANYQQKCAKFIEEYQGASQKILLTLIATLAKNPTIIE